MRLLALAIALAGSGLVAQSPTGFGRLSNPSGIPPSQAGAGFGRLVYSGTGGPPAARRPGFTPVPGRPFVPPAVAHPFHGNSVIVPYPVYYGGYYYPYDAPLAPPQGYEGDYGYSQQQPAPVVILNQNFRPDYQPGPYGSAPPQSAPPPPADPSQTQTQPQAAPGESSSIIFLIAMKD